MKTLITFLNVLFFTSAICYSQSGWYQLTSGTFSNLLSIQFPNNSTGFVSGENGTVSRTTDAGGSWVSLNVSTTETVPSVFFASPTAGICVVEDASYFISKKTTDAGNTWTTFSSSSWGHPLKCVHSSSASNGIVCGTNSFDYTTNGGSSWNGWSGSGFISGPYRKAYFLTAAFGFALNATQIARTINFHGGNNWTQPTLNPTPSSLTSISFADLNTGYLAGSNIYKTTDGGVTWSVLAPPPFVYNDIYAVPTTTVAFAVAANGIIIKTSNGGTNWYQLTSNTTQSLNSVWFINSTTGFIAGNSGLILKTTDGGGPPVVIQIISSKVPEDYSLSQNYPNPFNPVTNISFSIPQKSYVKITIYDATGKEIDKIVNFELNAGTYKVNWNGNDFSSGVYYYQLTTDLYKTTRRMILLK